MATTPSKPGNVFDERRESRQKALDALKKEPPKVAPKPEQTEDKTK